MRPKLIILFLLLVPIVDLFHSCGSCDKEPTPVSYSHKTFLVKNLDNSGRYAIESDTSQLNKNAYGIRLCLIREENITACLKQVNSIFSQSAYAMKKKPCYDYCYFASDSIVSIKIFTLNDFDSQHSANTDITDYFKVAHTYSDIKNYISEICYTFEEYAFRENSRGKELEVDLLLMNIPTATNNHQFKIQVELSDGRILEQQTTEIQLL